MARLHETQLRGRFDQPRDPPAQREFPGAQFLGESRLRLRQVNLAEATNGVVDVLGRVADGTRDLAEDALHLVALLHLQFAPPVGEVNDHERFDVDRLAGG